MKSKKNIKPLQKTLQKTLPSTNASILPEKPPPSRRQKIVEDIHGQKVADPYRWLEDASSKETRTWVTAQDHYTRRYLAGLPGRARLLARFKALSYVDSISPPSRKGQRYFFTRQHADKEKVVYYWQQGERGKPRVLLDPNTFSEDGSISLRGITISEDGRWAAYKLSENAADMATLYVMDVATGKRSEIDTINGARYAQASWTPQGDGFYYTRLPVDPQIPMAELPGHQAVYFHKLGEDPQTDRLIYPATKDPRTFVAAEISRDGHLLFLYIQYGWVRTDVYFKDLRRSGPRTKFKPFAVGQDALYTAYAWKGKIYVHTNEGAPRYRLFKVDPARIQRRNWQEIIAEDPEAVLQGFSLVGDHLALEYLRKAHSELVIATLDGKRVRRINPPNLASASGISGNPEDDTAYYSVSSYLAPPAVFRTSIQDGGQKLFFKVKLPIDATPFMAEQVHYPSKDGTRISMFVLRRKNAPMNGSTPLLLYGYGGFNITLTPAFSAPFFTWLEQGGSVAVPNLRGGGEYGEDWHQAGMLDRKQNTFDDFIAAIQYLENRGYTSPPKLAIMGGSNGGLLVGAAMTQRPELFRAVACHVPLLDMVRYHLFGSGQTWISEYGSAADPAQFKTILAYSPYQNVKPKTPYPALLMMSADSDDRVDPMHARKFTAAIQHASNSGHPVLIRVETKAGHGGGDMIKKRVEANADQFIFLLQQLGIRPR